jgi:hypothetical protein
MNKDDARAEVVGGYPFGQLAKAFVTAVDHEDAETRQRADDRVRRWSQVLAGMAGGSLRIGSRTPVSGLPSWVTPEVLRGGFATGKPVAGGPLRPHETELALRVGVSADRRALFAYHLTELGLAELVGLLEHGRYRVEVPEEAALLVAAWLLRSGDRLGALTLLDTLAPLASQLRFAPVPSDTPAPDPQLVWRETVGDVRRRLAARGPNERVEAMNEALAVWSPFGDDLLAVWLETIEDGRVAARIPHGWTERGAGLLDRYRTLAVTHTRCSKHRNPKENITILRSALEEVVAAQPLTPQRRGLLQHAVEAMVRRRGRPGSDQHTALRTHQADQAARPTHRTMAGIVLTRLASLSQDTGVRSTEPLTQPVGCPEAQASGVLEGAQIPDPVRRVVSGALAGSVEELIEHGLVPSAEVLARLVPQIAAATTAAVYPDPALRALVAANYRAFRNRRSLLLLNLEHQVRLDELPWVTAVNGVRRSDDVTRRDSHASLARVGQLTLDGFPATILPNPLIRELAALAKEAGLDLPWVEELAADIFMGTFSAKFLQAAKLAATVLRGSLYERYYGIDYEAILAIDDTRRRLLGARTSNTFDALCHDRAGVAASGYSVAANGTVIEQAQILTTHNLATLAGPVDIAPAVGWTESARRSLNAVCRLVARVHGNPRPLSTIKDAAYAWRQLLFYLSMSGPDDQAAFVESGRKQIRSQPEHVQVRLGPVIAGLAHVTTGGVFGPDGTNGERRRFLGWAADRHWMLGPRRPN